MRKRILLSTMTAALIIGFGLTACTENETTGHDRSGDTSTQTVCPVSGEELGSMGEPIVMTHAGKEVKLCCKSCIKKFNADPAKYTAKVHVSEGDS